ncbi:MAG TPA: OmpA family protein [Xanthobacteraceae bacterium]|nr:OmpA family protein [Xanthobacteraceae bacterium]
MRGSWRLLITTALSAPVVFGVAQGAAPSSPPDASPAARTSGVVIAQTTPDEEQRKAKQKAEDEKNKQKSNQNKNQQKNPQQTQQQQQQQGQQQKGRQQDNNRSVGDQKQDNRRTKDQPQKNQADKNQQKQEPGAQNQPVTQPAPAGAAQNQNQRRDREQKNGGGKQPPVQTGQPNSTTTPTQTETKQQPSATESKTQTPSGQPAGAAVVKSRESVAPSGIAKPTAQEAKPIAPAGKGASIAVQSQQGKTIQRVDELRGERKETKEGNRTVIREPDRTIIRENGKTVIRHDEFDRFRYGARDVRVEQRGNETRTVVVRPNGDRIVTIYDNNGYLLRRSRVLANGREIVLIDNRGPRGATFRVADFIVTLPPPAVRIPRERYIVDLDRASPGIVYETLIAPPVDVIGQPYSIDQIRYSESLRERMPRIDLDVNFESGSWDLTQDQIGKLAAIADGIKRAIDRNPSEVFLIEGHTDAVGSDVDNLSLSDRRAESVALALSQDFDVPPENLVTQGYGEQFLKVPTQGPERANRRVAVRRITPLLVGSAR